MKSFLLMATMAASFVLGLSNDAFAQRPANVVDFVTRSGGEFDRNPFDYDILVTAVLAADSASEIELVKALTNPDANLTLFAPNDLGFIRTARDLGYRGFSEKGAWEFLVAALTDIGGGDPFPTLTNILLYHVSPKPVSSLGLINRTLRGKKIPTLLEGVKIRPRFLTLIDQDPQIRNPRVTVPFDVRTRNGRVHTIQRVLIPVNL